MFDSISQIEHGGNWIQFSIKLVELESVAKSRDYKEGPLHSKKRKVLSS